MCHFKKRGKPFGCKVARDESLGGCLLVNFNCDQSRQQSQNGTKVFICCFSYQQISPKESKKVKT